MVVFVIYLLSIFSVILAGNDLPGNSIYYCRNHASINVPCDVFDFESSCNSTGNLHSSDPRYKMAKNCSLTIYDPVEGEEFQCYADTDISTDIVTTVKLATYKEPDIIGVDGCNTYPCTIGLDIASMEGLTCGFSGHIPNNRVNITWQSQLTSKDLTKLYKIKKVYDVQKSVKVKTSGTTVSCIIEGDALSGKPKKFDVIICDKDRTFKFCFVLLLCMMYILYHAHDSLQHGLPLFKVLIYFGFVKGVVFLLSYLILIHLIGENVMCLQTLSTTFSSV